jgi:uncharacterized protein YrrD
MRLQKGATVSSWDGDKIGSIDRVVLNPKTKEVTHVIVEKGFLFTTDKVVPISLVGTATEDKVTLRQGASDLDKLPDFEKKYYVRVTDPQEDRAPEAEYVPPLYWYPPIGLRWWGVPGYDYATPAYVVRTERHIPEGTVPLEEGAKVVSSDGEHMGDVEAVLTDPQQDRATHLVISKGLLFKDRKLVPTTWISRVMEAQVLLGVGTGLVHSLPEYRP